MSATTQITQLSQDALFLLAKYNTALKQRAFTTDAEEVYARQSFMDKVLGRIPAITWPTDEELKAYRESFNIFRNHALSLAIAEFAEDKEGLPNDVLRTMASARVLPENLHPDNYRPWLANSYKIDQIRQKMDGLRLQNQKMCYQYDF